MFGIQSVENLSSTNKKSLKQMFYTIEPIENDIEDSKLGWTVVN